jgi:hypothetical protein
MWKHAGASRVVRILLKSAVLFTAPSSLCACTHSAPLPRPPQLFDFDAALRALGRVEARDCYFLPPAGPIPFVVRFSAEGVVDMAAAEKGVEGTPAAECIATHLRSIKIAPYREEGFEMSLEVPHACDLKSNEAPPFSRDAVLAAIERFDLAKCAWLPGPRRGEAMVVTEPAGGLKHVYARAPSVSLPLGECVERELMRLRTPAYNGTQNWVLAQYTVPK